jgi:hypothetical protein
MKTHGNIIYPRNPNGKISFEWGLSLFISTMFGTIIHGFLCMFLSWTNNPLRMRVKEEIGIDRG